MVRSTKQPSDKRSQIRVEASVKGEKRVFSESVPEGLPTELTPHLEDFWRRGFSAASNCYEGPSTELAVEELPSLVDFEPEPRGRPIDDESEREGREAAKLREKNPNLTFGQIAPQVCRYRKEPHHRCKKACSDRVRQAFKQYTLREEVDRIAKGDLGD
jgi:hypothetical protein